MLFIFIASASPQDIIDALKQRLRTEAPPHSTNRDDGLRHNVMPNQNDVTRQPMPAHLPRFIAPQNMSNAMYRGKNVMGPDEGNVCVLIVLSVCHLKSCVLRFIDE